MTFLKGTHLLAALLVTAAGSHAFAADAAPPFGDNVQARGGDAGPLANARLKFLADKKGTVAFLGGSITEMEGHRPLVMAALQKRFPDTKFQFINAGVSSTCSTTGAFRLDAEVLSKGPVDLLFVEFAVNDDQDAHHTRDECIRGMEGIIRHARVQNPNIDIVVTMFVNEGMLTTLQAGKMPLTIETHEAVAARYQVPTIRLASEVAQEITAGKLTWKDYGGVHPGPKGNALCVGMIDELFSRAWNAPAKADAKVVASPLPEPLDPLNYAAGHFIDPKEAKVDHGFTLDVPNWRSLAGSTRANFTKIPMLAATDAGAQASLEFTGTAIGAYVVAGPDAGMIEASIDGGPFKTVDLFHTFSRTLHYPRTVMFADDLKPGKHALVIRMSATTKSAGHAARIMQFVAN